MSVQRVELDEHAIQEGTGEPLIAPDIALIGNVQVKLDVVIGDSVISVKELFSLSKGAVLQMNQLVNDPVQICLDGKVVARGELVAVDETFGVRITEIHKVKE